MIALEELNMRIGYNKDTGGFFHKQEHFPSVKVGDAVYEAIKNGGKYIKLSGKKYPSHRLAWYMYHGEWPNSNVMHKNGDKLDNSIDNLELAESVPDYIKANSSYMKKLHTPEHFEWTKENFQKLYYYENGQLYAYKDKLPIWRGLDKAGYASTNIAGVRKYYSHIIWFYHHGEFPSVGLEIDHIDHDRSNNRIENLRLVTRRENCMNKANKTHLTGVRKQAHGWSAHIGIGGKTIRIGSGYKTEQEAHEAYLKYIEDHPELK